MSLKPLVVTESQIASGQCFAAGFIEHTIGRPELRASKGADLSALAEAGLVDFALDLKDLYLKPDESGVRKGMLNLSLIVYDRNGRIVSRKDQIVALTLQPDVYAFFREAGVQLHAEMEIPQGQHWLRTGYDPATHKAGTMEIAAEHGRPDWRLPQSESQNDLSEGKASGLTAPSRWRTSI